MEELFWDAAPEWANLVATHHDGRKCFLDHNTAGKEVQCQFFGTDHSGLSFRHHGWQKANVISRRVRNKEDCLVDRNIFITQAFALMNTTSPKYNVFGAMYDAGCRFPEQD